MNKQIREPNTHINEGLVAIVESISMKTNKQEESLKATGEQSICWNLVSHLLETDQLGPSNAKLYGDYSFPFEKLLVAVVWVGTFHPRLDNTDSQIGSPRNALLIRPGVESFAFVTDLLLHICQKISHDSE